MVRTDGGVRVRSVKEWLAWCMFMALYSLCLCAHAFSCCLGGLGAVTGLSETHASIQTDVTVQPFFFSCTKKKMAKVDDINK